MDGWDLDRFLALSKVKVIKMSAFHMSWFIYKLRESNIFQVLCHFVIPVGDIAEVEVPRYHSIYVSIYHIL